MDAPARGPLPIVPMTALMGLGAQEAQDDENPMSAAPDEEGCAEHDDDDTPEDPVEAMNVAAQRWTTLISMKA
jgi:hypothetical protein